MKFKNLLLLLIAATVSTTVWAQETPPTQEQREAHRAKHERMKNMTPEQRVDHRTTKMAEALELDDTQSQKVSAVLMETEEQMETLRAEMKVLKERRRELLKAQEAKLKTILNTEQYAKFQEQIQRKKDRRAERGKGHRPHPPMPEDTEK